VFAASEALDAAPTESLKLLRLLPPSVLVMARALVLMPLIMCAVLTAACAQSSARAILSDQPSTAPGTKITMRNWQRYRQFMSQGMIALFEGSHFWRMPDDVVIEIGPPISIPLPEKYQQDTNAHASRVRLVQQPDGGYVPSGYVAGVPFPEPLNGDPALIGERIFWDLYYRYQPRVQGAANFSYSIDRAGDMTQTSESTYVQSQLTFLSDPGMPATAPDADTAIYTAKFNEQVSPEQSKYSTLLDLLPADPTRLDELYEYVPTLRRSLRLSQAARCAPVFGSDYLVDDENDGPPGLPQLFEVSYLGQQKILALVHAAPEAFDSPGTAVNLDPHYYFPGGAGVVPFPRPSAGRWELRDSYVIALERLPQFSNGYCYGKRVLYVDKENYFAGAQLDLYDSSGQLFKSQLIFSYPERIPGTERDLAQLVAGSNTSFLINFKDRHLSLEPNLRACINSECAGYGYLDIRRYASPDGLMKIAQ
jgi:Protein of unknown function (DUF1329)